MSRDESPAESCAIGVMAKTPRPGHSKTRLCPPLTPDQAAAMSAAFLRDTMDNLLTASRLAPVVGYAAYTPLGAEALLRPHLPPDTRCVLADGDIAAPSGVEGFGRCLLHATQALFAAGHQAACVLSSDTPTLPTAILGRAATLLLQGDAQRVVLGACDDGGYYLLGMRTLHAGLFADIAWSTETVADATRARAATLGLELIELPPWYDIDDGASLLRLAGDQAGYAAPNSRTALRTLGLAPGFGLSAVA